MGLAIARLSSQEIADHDYSIFQLGTPLEKRVNFPTELIVSNTNKAESLANCKRVLMV